MTMTATEARGIRGRIVNSSDCLTIGLRLALADLIADYHADVKLKDNGGLSIKLSTGAFYEMELA